MKKLLSIMNVPVQSNGRRCPVCDSTYLDRVQRGMLDRLLSLFTQVKRYSCSSCGWQARMVVSKKSKISV